MGQEHKLDARPFGLPQRFNVITGKLSELAEGDTLLLINDFEPLPLYGELERRGLAYESRQVGPSEWHVVIKR